MKRVKSSLLLFLAAIMLVGTNICAQDLIEGYKRVLYADDLQDGKAYFLISDRTKFAGNTTGTPKGMSIQLDSYKIKWGEEYVYWGDFDEEEEGFQWIAEKVGDGQWAFKNKVKEQYLGRKTGGDNDVIFSETPVGYTLTDLEDGEGRFFMISSDDDSHSPHVQGYLRSDRPNNCLSKQNVGDDSYPGDGATNGYPGRWQIYEVESYTGDPYIKDVSEIVEFVEPYYIVSDRTKFAGNSTGLPKAMACLQENFKINWGDQYVYWADLDKESNGFMWYAVKSGEQWAFKNKENNKYLGNMNTNPVESDIVFSTEPVYYTLTDLEDGAGRFFMTNSESEHSPHVQGYLRDDRPNNSLAKQNVGDDDYPGDGATNGYPGRWKLMKVNQGTEEPSDYFNVSNGYYNIIYANSSEKKCWTDLKADAKAYELGASLILDNMHSSGDPRSIYRIEAVDKKNGRYNIRNYATGKYVSGTMVDGLAYMADDAGEPLLFINVIGDRKKCQIYSSDGDMFTPVQGTPYTHIGTEGVMVEQWKVQKVDAASLESPSAQLKLALAKKMDEVGHPDFADHSSLSEEQLQAYRNLWEKADKDLAESAYDIIYEGDIKNLDAAAKGEYTEPVYDKYKKVPLRVMSYNVKHCAGNKDGLNLPRTAEAIAAQHADVVALQEVDSMFSSRSDYKYQIKELAEATGMYGIFCSALPGYGIGILCKEMPLSIKAVSLTADGEPRRMLMAEFDNYVFASLHVGLSANARRGTGPIIKAAAEEWVEKGKPLIIAGDFNDDGTDEEMQGARGELTKYLQENGFTFHSDMKTPTWSDGTYVIDHIISYDPIGGVEKQGYEVVDDKVTSDHMPIVGDLIVGFENPGPEDPVAQIGNCLINYSFDRDGDDSGTYAATPKGSASFVTLDDGNRVLSTGNSSGYLDLGTQMAHSVLGQLTGDYTISLDLNVGANNSLGSFCWAWAMGNGTNQYTALVNKAGNADWYYEIKNSSANMAYSGKGLIPEKWHTVTVVQEGNTCTIYIDGEKRGTCSTSKHPAEFASSVTQSWLGRSPYSADAYMTNTMMDNFRIYGKALTAEQVKTLFDARPGQEVQEQVKYPVIYDFASLNDAEQQFTGTLKNGAELTTFASTPVLSLGSADGYFDFGEDFGKAVNSLDDKFTISTTLYVPKTTSVSGAGNFIWCFSKSSSQGYLFLSAKDTRYAISPTNWSGEAGVSAQMPIAQGEWVNVAYVQDGSSATIYVNGQAKGKSSSVTLYPAYLNQMVHNYLGKSCYDGDAYLKDALYADFRIYNTAIGTEELAELAAKVYALNHLSSAEAISLDLETLTLPSSINNLYEGVTLPTKGTYGSAISWESDNTDLLSNEGKVVATPEGVRQHVTLTATLTNEDEKATKTFDVYVHQKDSPYAHYLFTFFPSNTDENIYYAVSDNGYDYKVINNSNPVISAKGITVMGGLRDPHILRGEDGYFYMVATDMRSELGWSSNRGMVLMRSDDLVTWKTSTVHFPKRYEGTYFANVTRVWAPETIYDPVAKKYMVYFSILTNDGTVPYDKVFYAYANEDFTDLEAEPTYLYDRGGATIDMDIVFNENDSLYHAVYKNEGAGGICQVTATSLTAPEGEEGSQWSAPSGTLQQTTEAVEGAGIFRLINSDDWILMYDCYMNGHYQFCSSPDLFNFTFRKNTTTQGAFTPRHGTVIPITEEEYQSLLLLPDVTGLKKVECLEFRVESEASARKVLDRSRVIITDGNGNSYDLNGRPTLNH